MIKMEKIRISTQRVLVPLTFFAGAALGLETGCVPFPTTDQTPVATAAVIARDLQIVTPVADYTKTPEAIIPASTSTPSPPTATPTAEIRVEAPQTLFEVLMEPFVREANARKKQRAANDPEWSRRVDSVLNQDRVNFLLFGQGFSHEPPDTNKAKVGAFTIISYDKKLGKFHKISISHDFHDPVISKQRFGKIGVINPDTRIDKAYEVGGFEMMRKTIESATGLSIDFQLAFTDREMAKFIDVFGGIDVGVKVDTKLYPYWYYDEQKRDFVLSPAREYKGDKTYRMNGWEAVGYIASVPIEDVYDKNREHHVREVAVIEALTNAFEKKNESIIEAARFWPGLINFVGEKLNRQGIDYDFDLKSLVLDNFVNSARSFGEFITQNSPNKLGIPAKGIEIYIADPRSGITHNGLPLPVARYGRGDMYIPSGGDPYTDDVIGKYWAELRNFIKKVMIDGQLYIPQPTAGVDNLSTRLTKKSRKKREQYLQTVYSRYSRIDRLIYIGA